MSVSEKIQYFQSKRDELRKIEMEFVQKKGEFDHEFQAWLREQGVPENFSLLDLIDHFRVKLV